MERLPNPYVGPDAIGYKQKLFGRDDEANELVDLLLAERIVLLYSPSGAGKTSLIQAKICSAMKQEDFQVLPIVRPGAEQTTLNSDQQINLYVSRTISTWEKDCPETIDSLKNIAPFELDNYFLERNWVAGDLRLKFIIFDQFEEILTSTSEDQDVKLEFFHQLGQALLNQEIWALFSIREDYIAELDRYRHYLPTRLNNRYRLNLLSRTEVKQSIIGPAKETAGIEFTDKAVTVLLDDLCKVTQKTRSGKKVEYLSGYAEPLHLQLVCRRLWNRLPESIKEINNEVIKDLGKTDVDEALGQYYAESVHDVAEKSACSERRLRDWLEQKLISPLGVRLQVLRGKIETDGLATTCVDALKDKLILRSDVRCAGSVWYELTHDRLTTVILQSNASWLDKELEDFQKNAIFWNKHVKEGNHHASVQEFLTRDELKKAEKWSEQHSEKLTKIDKNFLDANRKKCDWDNKYRFVKFLGIVLFCVTLLGGVLGVVVIKLIDQNEITSHQNEVKKRQTDAEAKAARLEADARAATAKAEKRQAKLEIDNFIRNLNEEKTKKVIQKMLSQSDAQKFRLHNHELASLLAIQAYRFFPGHHDSSWPTQRVEEILRDSLQSKPFAKGQILEKYSKGTDKKNVVIGKNATTLQRDFNRIEQVTSQNVSTFEFNNTSTYPYPVEILSMKYSPGNKYFGVVTTEGFNLFSLTENSQDDLEERLEISESPAAWCITPDDNQLTLLYSDKKMLQYWDLKNKQPRLIKEKVIEQESTSTLLTQVSAFTCGPDGAWVAFGDSEGNVGLLNQNADKLHWSEPNNFGAWPDTLRTKLGFRADHLNYGVTTLLSYKNDNNNDNRLFAVYQQGPIKVFYLDNDGKQIPSPYTEHKDKSKHYTFLIPNEKSKATLEVLQQQGQAVRRVANVERYLCADISSNGNYLGVAGSGALVGLYTLTNPKAQIDGEAPVLQASYREIPGLGASVKALRLDSLKNESMSGEEGGTQKNLSSTVLTAVDSRLNRFKWFIDGLKGTGYTTRAATLSDGQPGIVYALRFLDQDGEQLAYGTSRESGIAKLHSENLSIALSTEEFPEKIRTFGQSEDMSLLVSGTGTKDEYIVLMSLNPEGTWDKKTLPSAHTDGLWSVAVNKLGTMLVTGGWDERAFLWEKTGKEWKHELISDLMDSDNPISHDSPVIATAIFSDESSSEVYIATGTRKGVIRLWNKVNGGLRGKKLLKTNGPVHSLAFSSDGTYLVAGDDNGNLHVWRKGSTDYEHTASTPAHVGSVHGIDFSSSESLVTGGSDGQVLIWSDIKNLQNPLHLRGPSCEVMSVDLSPKERFVAAGDADGNIHIWELGLSKLIEQSCKAMSRNLTQNEWKQYVGNGSYECTCPSLCPQTKEP